MKTWDGLKLAEFWKSDGCGPSAVAPFGDGFLVAGYDAGAMVRISVDGRTIQTIDKDISGGGFLGPNDIAPDGKGGVYFSASGPWESGAILGKIYHMAAISASAEARPDEPGRPRLTRLPFRSARLAMPESRRATIVTGSL